MRLLDEITGRMSLAALPTVVREFPFAVTSTPQRGLVKHDELTSDTYGGNKVRKLEYLLPRANERGCDRIATFGTAGSHHALATAVYADRLGFPCTCFLSHQRRTPETADVLASHLAIGTQLVPFGGAYGKRMETLRRHLWRRRSLVIPPGGSSWLGTLGFVNAGLELAAQVGDAPPDRVYIAAGTMGSAAGLALGLALAGLASEVHAVRVSHTWLCNEDAMRRSMHKTATMMRRLDSSTPEDLLARSRLRLRHDFFAGGYAHSDDATDSAIAFAADHLGLALEATYTGKAMAAMLSDLRQPAARGRRYLFWNTYDPVRPRLTGEPREHRAALPPEFRRYLS